MFAVPVVKLTYGILDWTIQEIRNSGSSTVWKVSKYGVFYGSYFPVAVFGITTKIYGVNLCNQSEYRKLRTKKNSVSGNFSRSVKQEKF